MATSRKQKPLYAPDGRQYTPSTPTERTRLLRAHGYTERSPRHKDAGAQDPPKSTQAQKDSPPEPTPRTQKAAQDKS